MNVCAAIEQQLDHLVRRCLHGPMERRPSFPVGAADELWLGVEQLPHAIQVVRVGGLVDGMIPGGRGCRHRPPGPAAERFEEPGDRLVAAIAGDGGQGLARGTGGVGIRAGVQQHLHRLEVALARGKAEGLTVAGEPGILTEQPAKRRRIAGARREDGLPDIHIRGSPRDHRDARMRAREA